MPKIYAHLSVTSKKTNLQEISKITGLVPAGGHNINDVSITGIVLDYSQWDYETAPLETFYTEDVSSRLIMAFKNNIDGFVDFIHKNCCEVSICFVISDVTDTRPALTINREMINFAAKINAEIYFDGMLSTVTYG